MLWAMARDEDGAGYRHGRLQQLIGEELAALVRDEVQDPALDGVRLTAVDLSVDYRSARVRYVTDDDAKPMIDRVAKAFARASAFLRRRVGEALELKRLPTLNFVYDRDAAAAARVRDLLSDEKK